jgi:hypothetical protein
MSQEYYEKLSGSPFKTDVSRVMGDQASLEGGRSYSREGRLQVYKGHPGDELVSFKPSVN